MSSKKLRKYLAYYRKTLSEDPENIEARLRLAALFREMERPSHAIEEYGTAAKLLASEGLPLEAIAACKAILELDPSHKETQFFLARLYAQVPEATGDSVRVAQPVEADQARRAAGAASPTVRGDAAADSPGRLAERDRDAITLDRPKSSPGQGGQESETVTASLQERASSDFEAAMEGPTQEFEAQDRAEVRKQGRDESTKMQMPDHRQALREQSSTDDDRETIELGVFDIESLKLEERETGQWQNLDFLDEVDEPDTVEVELEERTTAESNGAAAPGAEREFRVSALPQIPLFSQLPRQVFVEVLDAMELELLDAGTEILSPGDPVGCLYVIVAGTVRIEKDLIDGRSVKLDILGEGQVFGEFRLLTGKGGWARVVAETDLELLAIRDEVVYQIGREYPQLWQVMWSFYYQRMLNHAMASSPMFRMLNREERELVGRHFEIDEVRADDTFFERGEAVDTLSLIVRGSVRVEVPDGDGVRLVDTLEEGAFVGVSPCAQEVSATATARARTDVVYYKMPGTIFRELMYGLPDVADAVRDLVRRRQARTPSLADEPSVPDRV